MALSDIQSAALTLEGRSVDVWPVHLEATDQVLAAFSRLLTPAETVKAGRFRFEHLRRSWVLARGALRLLLGAYLSIDPADIRLRFGTRGKPELDMPGDIAFNLSHSGAMALFGFTQNVEIGVDIEHVHPVGDMLGIARRFYCKEETSDLMSLDPAGQEAAFFHCWTRKEAYLKAIGEGLYEPLNGFRVSLGPDEPARIVHIGNSVTAAAEWSLHDISCIPEYAGALAYRGAPRPVTMLRQISPAELLGRFSRFADLQSEGFRF